MGPADFHYGGDTTAEVVRDAANDPAGVPLAVSIYADRAHLQATMREDAEAAGFRLGMT